MGVTARTSGCSEEGALQELPNAMSVAAIGTMIRARDKGKSSALLSAWFAHSPRKLAHATSSGA